LRPKGYLGCTCRDGCGFGSGGLCSFGFSFLHLRYAKKEENAYHLVCAVQAEVAEVTAAAAKLAVAGATVSEESREDLKDRISSMLVQFDPKTLQIIQANPLSPLHSATSFEELAKAAPDHIPVPATVLKALFEDLHYTSVRRGVQFIFYLILFNFFYTTLCSQPSRIQEAALPLLLREPFENMVFQSQAGTGKTAAFALDILSRCDPTQPYPQVCRVVPLVLIPRSCQVTCCSRAGRCDGAVACVGGPNPQRH
jgi:hypothetical protein